MEKYSLKVLLKMLVTIVIFSVANTSQASTLIKYKKYLIPIPSGATSIEEHRTGFLFSNDNLNKRTMSFLSSYNIDGTPPIAKEATIELLKNNCANSIYLYTANENDGVSGNNRQTNPYTQYSFTDSGWGLSQNLDTAKMEKWRAELKKYKSQGLSPILWLIADDSPGLRSNNNLQNYFNDMYDWFDDLVLGYVVALEADENNTNTTNAGTLYPYEVKALTGFLASKTDKSVGIHFSAKNYSLNYWNTLGYIHNSLDAYYHQYGFNLPASDSDPAGDPASYFNDIEDETEYYLNQFPWGNNLTTFVAAEYTRTSENSNAETLSNAAIDVASDKNMKIGVGNVASCNLNVN